MSNLVPSLILLSLLCSTASGAATGKLVVHEWGTFTSFAGSDGVQLEFRPLTDSDLPDFVYDRARQAGHPQGPAGGGDKARIHATVRMETPVTYFYTEREREIDVRVAFPQGLLTEFYPPVTAMSPPYDANQPEPLHDSSLHWASVHLLPSASATVALPAAAGGTHYGHARETDSAFVRCGEHVEKFLFYRGVGNFTLPVTLRAEGQGRFTVDCGFAAPIAAAFLVECEGGRLRFAPTGEIRGTRKLTLSAEAASLGPLRSAMERALINAGLNEKEARAMLETWRSAWFSEEGARLLYLLPTEVTDRMVPLSINPPPDAMVRVMVGRLEILTPEREARIERDIGRTGASSPGEFGRFAEAALRRVKTLAEKPDGSGDTTPLSP